MNLSPLEFALINNATERSQRASVFDLDILVSVLKGTTGTPAQRNALLRVIKANKPEGNNLTSRIIGKINLELPPAQRIAPPPTNTW